jgi:TolB-like protein
LFLKADAAMTATAHSFGPFRIDAKAGLLFKGNEPVALGQRAVALLCVLLEQRGAPVSKDALIERAWPGLAVEESNLPVQISALRRVLADEPGGENWIETLPRRGYRYIGPTASDGESAEAPTSQVVIGASPTVAAPRLSIVVLPFTNIGSDGGQDYFVDGVTESLTTDLSRISGLVVIARNTAFSYKSRSVDARQVGRELSVRYILEGSVQRGGNQLRVNVQLIDAETAHHLWADRFDKPAADLFIMQDEIVSRLAHTLNSQLIEAEARRAARSLQPDAVDLCFQGRACFNKGITTEYLAQARGFFERALILDRSNIEALVGAARVDVLIASSFLTDDRAPHLAAAEEVLSKVLSMAPQHAFAHLNMGFVQIFTNRAAQCIAECESALALDRNLAEAHGWIGLANHVLGRSAQTEGHIEEALRLSPRDTFAYRWMVAAGFAKLQLNADAEAVTWFRRSIEANRNHPFVHFVLASALAQLGSINEARAAVHAGLVLHPGFTIRRYRASAWSDHPAYLAGRERIYEGMRMAGVPEGSVS